MSATNTTEDNVLKLIFNATAWGNIADNTATSPATDLYISLHTADPGETGSQTTSEATYTSYARVAVARTSGAWSVSNPTVSNVAAVLFPTCTGGSNTITHFGIGLSSGGAGTLLFSGALNASLSVSNGITPNFAIGDLTTTCD